MKNFTILLTKENKYLIDQTVIRWIVPILVTLFLSLLKLYPMIRGYDILALSIATIILVFFLILIFFAKKVPRKLIIGASAN